MCRKERLVTSLGHLSLEDGCGSNSNNKKIQKNAYETAFVFLSIYGLCRNISVTMLFLLTFHCTFVADYWSTPFYVVYCIFLLAMLHNYFRFRQYYIAHIYASLSARQ